MGNGHAALNFELAEAPRSATGQTAGESKELRFKKLEYESTGFINLFDREKCCMKVSIKDLSVTMEIKNNGIELDVYDNSGKHLGDLVSNEIEAHLV